MLNGKFFTGLPPRMAERETEVRNRLESHFFWPDETNLESANECRSKRRNTDVSSKPSVTASTDQLPSTPTNDAVDSKQKFNQEFTRSSIQFNYPQHQDQDICRSRNILLNKGHRFQITEKPTATVLELPEDAGSTDLSAERQKKLYASNITFYEPSEQKVLDSTVPNISQDISKCQKKLDHLSVNDEVNDADSELIMPRNIQTADKASRIDDVNATKAKDVPSKHLGKLKTNDDEHNESADVNHCMRDMRINNQAVKKIFPTDKYPTFDRFNRYQSFTSSVHPKRDVSYPWLLSRKQRLKSMQNSLPNQQNRRPLSTSEKSNKSYGNKSKAIPSNDLAVNQDDSEAVFTQPQTTPVADTAGGIKRTNRQHLHSSLRCHDGMVTSDASSAQSLQQMRTLARNWATRRVSVGLPD